MRDVEEGAELPVEDPLPDWSELKRNTVGYDWREIELAVARIAEEDDPEERSILAGEAQRLLFGGRKYAEILEFDIRAILERAIPLYSLASRIVANAGSGQVRSAKLAVARARRRHDKRMAERRERRAHD